MAELSTTRDASTRSREADAPRDSLLVRFNADKPLRLDVSRAVVTSAMRFPVSRRA